ncbi:MAG: hypothetical protein IPK00_27350 [Deltaproteobacteria bacterium]|nr:hypothetical protein [Deltaproteobacteria bacterium]
MACRSGLIALALGLALGLGSALALGVVAGEDEAAIVVLPVELVDPAPDDPFDLDPLFAPGPVRGKEPQAGAGKGARAAVDAASAAHERTVELAGGDVVTIRLLDAKALVLHDEDIAFVELAEAAIGEDGPAEAEGSDPEDARNVTDAESEAGGASALLGERFAVYAVLSDAGRAAWAPFAADHANAYLLVEIAGRPVDLVRPLGWTRGLRIGVFADEPVRSHYVAALPFAAQ